MAKLAQKTDIVRISRAELDAMLADAAKRKSRKSAAPVSDKPESEVDRVIRTMRMQNGFRGRILRHVIGKGPGAYNWVNLHNVDALSDIDAVNMSACLTHIAWKMQLIDVGYTLAVEGRGENVQAKLARTAPVVKARKPRTPRVVKADAPTPPVDSSEVA